MRRNTFEIPWQLVELLAMDPEWRGAVDLSLATFAQFITDRPPFFPEFTDHGWMHLEDVIDTAVSLMRQECWKTAPEFGATILFTPADAACLILSVLLHDAAMHLTEDTFRRLVESHDAPLAGFGDQPWSELWAKFLSEASRWDDQTLSNVYGALPAAKPDKMDLTNIRDSERRLIGEFIRRHHPRLAHEFGTRGVPGLGQNAPRLVGKAESVGDLIGVIARSHGLSLRDCIPYLVQHFDIREYRGVHAIFVMSLLRVSDAVQIQSHRAPEMREEIQRLHCPLSQREWRTHQSVTNISRSQQDPEAILIQALPKNVKVFLRLKDWLRAIQEELDASWAVLGEVYGRFTKEGFDRFGFVLRRVYSNLDDAAQFATRVPYIPVRASFDTATPELLKLLVKPLYGNRPEVGIRELLQNAVDAVRERTAYETNKPASSITAEGEPDVIVSIDNEVDGSNWLTISDRGIGMTPEIITEYFLRAGASFRKSTIWRSQFENHLGESTILRSGRFGVGALAAFLLGPRIHVKSRHISMPVDHGLEFTATLDTDVIELRRCELPFGTTIRVQIEQDLADELAQNPDLWDWFALEFPKVCRIQRQSETLIQQGHHLPNAVPDLPVGWHRIVADGLDDVHWSFQRAPYLTVNGIKVVHDPDNYRNHPRLVTIKQEADPFKGAVLWNMPIANLNLRCPKVSVFDKNGVLPLNLQRTGLTESVYPFNSELVDDVARDLLAWVLTHSPTQPLYAGSIDSHYFKTVYKGFTVSSGNWGMGASPRLAPWFSTAHGAGLTDTWLITALAVRSALIVPGDNQLGSLSIPLEDLSAFDVLFGLEVGDTITDIMAWLNMAMGVIPRHSRMRLPGLKLRGSRLLVSEPISARLKGQWVDYSLLRAIDVEWENKYWKVLRIGDCPPSPINYESLATSRNRKRPQDTPGLLTEWYIDDWPMISPASPIGKVWSELIGSEVIAFNPIERRKLLRDVFLKLGAYTGQIS